MLGKETQQGEWEDKEWILSDSVNSLKLSFELLTHGFLKKSGEKNRHTREIHPIQKEALKHNSDKWLICF